MNIYNTRRVVMVLVYLIIKVLQRAENGRINL